VVKNCSTSRRSRLPSCASEWAELSKHQPDDAERADGRDLVTEPQTDLESFHRKLERKI